MRTNIVFFMLIVAVNMCNAQWVQINGPLGSDVRCFATLETNLFAGTLYDGVFLSTNDGENWTQVNGGLTNTSVYALAVSPNGAGGTNLFAGTSGVFLSTNNGANWTAAGLADKIIVALAVSGTSLFAGTTYYSGGVFRSSDNGASWTQVNSGMTDMNVRAFAVSGPNLFAGTEWGGVFLSTDGQQCPGSGCIRN
jgi:hypothetical protein